MKENMNAHMSVVGITTLAAVGLTLKSIYSGWELWMIPVLILGMVVMWGLYIFQYSTARIREYYYLGYGMLGAFYYSVHPESVFNFFVIMSIMVVTMSLFDESKMLHLIMAEFWMVTWMQIVLISGIDYVLMKENHAAILFFQSMAFMIIYRLCCRRIEEKKELRDEIQKGKLILQEMRDDTDDFLTNISHELRTPVNVVNGITTLILQKESRDDVLSINEAGLRLSRQIEDIQDYTEIKRGQIILEEDKYMITSIINDVIVGMNGLDREKNLEFVVDLDPKVPALMQGDIRKIHKIIRHLLDNAVKFTLKGGVCIRICANKKDYGVNLIIEVADTGLGMSRQEVENASTGFYQANKKRNRSTGGIGLGLNVVYGFVHKMDGFVKIESRKGQGTRVRTIIPQKVLDPSPCLRLDENVHAGTVLFHVNPMKYHMSTVRFFYNDMAAHLAAGLGISLYAAAGLREVKAVMADMNVTHIFMGAEEYRQAPEYFDSLAEKGVKVIVAASQEVKMSENSKVHTMRKPVYGVPVIRVLNGASSADMENEEIGGGRPVLDGVRTLIVDDEPMNLVVATGLFREYNMITDIAESGREAIRKFKKEEYDIVFMDHMMPEMDGVETMKKMRQSAFGKEKNTIFVALTANAVSGAREMFYEEGFDGFISKPIDIADFERVMKRVLPDSDKNENGGVA